MPENQILVPLKINLQISSDALDSYLLAQIRAAQDYIKTEGITLKPESTGDQMLVAMYAAYLYPKRRNTGDDSKMPRMLRWALNNRLFQEKISEG